jgi:Domain of unknown function (DUF4402)
MHSHHALEPFRLRLRHFAQSASCESDKKGSHYTSRPFLPVFDCITISDSIKNGKGLGLLLAMLLQMTPAALLAQSGLPPVKVSNERDLDFGKLALDGSGGTVSLDSVTSTKLVSGGVINLGGLHQSARFRLTGAAGQTILVGSPRVQMHYRGTIIDMLPDLGPVRVRQFDANGRLTIDVGGILAIPASSPPGTYKGLLQLVAEYANCFPVVRCVTVTSRPLDAVVVDFE